MLSLDQIKTGKHDNEVRNRAKVFCSTHPTEETRIFCTDCNQSICNYCEGHSHCQHISIRDAIFEKMTDFERILADVHRKAEVLRAEIQHLKRLNEQLLTEKGRCQREIHDVAADAHQAVNLWVERSTKELDSRYEHDLQMSHEKQDGMVSKDRQLRRCGDFISKVIQIGTPDEIICLQRAKCAIEELLASSNVKIPPTANIYHLNQGERLLDIDLGTIEVIEPEGSVCSLLMDEVEPKVKRPESAHSSSSDSGITEEPPLLPPKQERFTPIPKSPAPETHRESSSAKIAEKSEKVSEEPEKKAESPPGKHIILRNPAVRLLLSIGRKGKNDSGGISSSPIIDVSTNGEIFLLDSEAGRIVVYSHKGSLLRHYKFAIKGVPFTPVTFALYGEKLALCQDDTVVLASPVDGHIFK